MTRIFSTTILLLLAAALAPATFGGSATVPEPAVLHLGTATADTVHVAPPTGETEADRASILAALDEVEPGGTVLSSPLNGLGPSHSSPMVVMRVRSW